MNSEIKTYTYPNGEIQRVQVVRLENWSQLDFLYLEQKNLEQQVKALECFRDIYQNYLVPACPWIFSQMVMFSLPDDVIVDKLLSECAGVKFCDEGTEDVPNAQVDLRERRFLYESEKYGIVSDRLLIASIVLQNGVKIKKGKPVFSDAKAEALYKELESRGCVRIVCGKLSKTQIIPVGKSAGYLSEVKPEAQLKVNANFFIMDPIDCATIYDQVGTPFGLCIKNGVIQQPPLFGREALFIENDGTPYITKKTVNDLLIEIHGKTYIPGKNATIFSRPEKAKAPEGKGISLVIVGRRVVAVKRQGTVEIPASGFVMQVSKGCKAMPGDEVTYHGLKDVQFGIQVGNSIMRKGVKTDKFLSRFYNIYHLERVPFPPSLYPMNFEKARAARIALGSDKEGKPVLFWVEGQGKLSYIAGEDSTGASLLEMADIAVDLQLRNVVNLDGGGSAQILLNNQRVLRISDRNKEDNSEAERLVPLGLVME